MSQGQGESLCWCPVMSELGVSSCEVTQITGNPSLVETFDDRPGYRSDLQMTRVIVQKSDESTKLFEWMSVKSGKDPGLCFGRNGR